LILAVMVVVVIAVIVGATAHPLVLILTVSHDLPV